MKHTLIALAVVLGIAGCATKPKEVDPVLTPATPAVSVIDAVPFVPKEHVREENKENIVDQQFISSFKRNGVKLEWACDQERGSSKACANVRITAIEVTGYAPAYGTSETNRETAFAVAHDVALDKLVRFIKQDVTSSRVTKTLTKNIEKGEDRLKVGQTDATPIEADDTSTDNNVVSRVNTNETVRKVIEIIKTKASGIVRGAVVLDEQVVDKQTVLVTLRWTVDQVNGTNTIRSFFQ